MGVKNFLIEGVSGTGKTAVAEELERRGYHVIHGDRELAYVGDPETGEPLNCPSHASDAVSVAWLNKHWIWPVEKVRSIIADNSNAFSFICGGSRNHHMFIDLFDEVFVLDVDLDTLNGRLAKRPPDEFGGRLIERELIRRMHATNEDVPTNAKSIDATAPISEVVNIILSKSAVAVKGRLCG